MFQFDSDRPIFLQIAVLLESQILKGTLSFGSKLPSIRELSLQYRVNPNTVQKALAQLEDKGLIETRRTQGKFVTYSPDQVQTQKKENAHMLCKNFLEQMGQLGFDPQEALELLKEEIYASKTE